MNLKLSTDIRRLHLPPRRGKEKVAQGKEAQRLPPWVTDPTTTPSFHRPQSQPVGWLCGRWKEGSIHYFVTPDGASLVRGYSLISSLRDFRSARCARKSSNSV